MRQINTQLTRDKVVAELRREILYGTLKSNQELYQDKIADELGVSRMPVREALQILDNEGLVTVKPNKVATVNEISGKFIHDHFEIRTLLEQEALRRVCKREVDCKEIWEYYHQAQAALERDDFKTFNDFNGKIHGFIWQTADNIQLEKILSQLWHTMETSDYAKKYAQLSNDDHKIIIESIENHDEKTAVETITTHIRRSYERIKIQMPPQDES